MPETRLQKREWTDDDGREREQWSATIPKELVEAYEWEKGDRLEWTVDGQDRIRAERVE